MDKFKRIFKSSSVFYASPFRPFFLFAMLYSFFHSIVDNLQNISYISSILPKETINLGQHEIIVGIFIPILSGFLLTAIPRWTKTNMLSYKPLTILVLIWAMARLFTLGNGVTGPLPAILLNTLFSLMVLLYLIRPLIDKNNRHLHLLAYQLTAFIIIQITAYIGWFNNSDLIFNQYLQVLIGIGIIMIITVLGRISMIVVRQTLTKYNVENTNYFARPPRRNFAILIVTIYLFVNNMFPESSISGWLALACAAAILNILNDWHLPNIWRDLYVRAIYIVYLFIAIGFLLKGINSIWGGALEDTFNDLQLSSWIDLSILMITLVSGHRLLGQDYLVNKMTKGMILLMTASSFCLLQSTFGNYAISGIQSVGSVCCSLSLLCYLLYFPNKLLSEKVDGKKG